MKTRLIGTSWKMNKPLTDALNYCETLARELPRVMAPGLQPFFIPPFTALASVSQFFHDRQLPWLTGAQNMHYAEAGAWTGEISASMLVDAGATLVELGHSERRQHFNETDGDINKKVHMALRHGLRPLICVGDSAEEKRWGVSRETVIRQVKIALHGLTAHQAINTCIAYEPIWAIGEHGVPATPHEAAGIHQAIREALTTLWGPQIAEEIPLLYGGSVNYTNVSELLFQENIDGLFIGRAAWDAEGYCQIIARIVQDLGLKSQ